MKFGEAISFPFRGPTPGPTSGCFWSALSSPSSGRWWRWVTSSALKKLIQNIRTDAPRFDFARFSEYLTRGLYPFLASLVIVLAVYVILIPIVLVFVVGFVIEQKNQTGIVILIIAAALVYVGLLIALTQVIQPMIFKAGLEGTFAAAFDRVFVFDYLRRVGLLALGVHFLAMLMAIPLMAIACVPLVGMGAAMAILMQFQAHLNTQLYLTYLAAAESR